MIPGIRYHAGLIQGHQSAPVVGSTSSGNKSNSSSYAVPLPSGIVAGNLLILTVGMGRSLTLTLSTPAGWTLLREGTKNGECRPYIWYKIADGSEGATATVSVNEGYSIDWCAIGYRITGHTANNLTINTETTGVSATASYAQGNINWSPDSLGIAITAHAGSGSEPTAISGYSSQITAAQTSGSTIRVTSSIKVVESTGETPGNQVLSGSLNWNTSLLLIG